MAPMKKRSVSKSPELIARKIRPLIQKRQHQSELNVEKISITSKGSGDTGEVPTLDWRTKSAVKVLLKERAALICLVEQSVRKSQRLTRVLTQMQGQGNMAMSLLTDLMN